MATKTKKKSTAKNKANKKTSSANKTNVDLKKLLHVGCNRNQSPIPVDFKEYKEVRLDIDKEVEPDIVADIKDMKNVEDSSHDAVFSSHNIEHLYLHEVPQALSEFARVLKGGGQLIITMPDVQRVAEHVAQGNIDDQPLFNSPMGPIFAIDILYGHTGKISKGNQFWAHRTGFTAKSLGAKLVAAGFFDILIVREGYNLWARAYKPKDGQLINEAKYMTLDTANYPFGAKVYEQGFDFQTKTTLKTAIDKTLEKSGLERLYN